MFGWNGRFLNVNLTNGKSKVEPYDEEFALRFIGGRGFAAKILWDRLPPKTDPLSPQNLLIFAVGPLTGYALPNSGKLVVASKSPLTGGYGDGNIGTWASVHMRRAGYDAVIITGKSAKPTVLHIKDNIVEFLDATDLWGLSSFEAETQLRKSHGKNAGIVSIGQGGENLVKFACVVAQEGRAGGRPGIGAVMGSKNLKAVLIEGTGELTSSDPKKLRERGIAGYREILAKDEYAFWKRQGTMSTIEWANEHSVLPTRNYQEGLFSEADKIGGYAAEAMKVGNRGCPNCNMTCGNIVLDAENRESELDYENIAMLGSNIGLGDMAQVCVLNRMADELGLDSISLGNVLGFAVEASQKGLVDEKLSWGSFADAKELAEDIAFRRGLGNVFADGVRLASRKIGGHSANWAMQIKGLEISGYDCHTAPAMALAYATSPIGAHHKDAWVIGWEMSHDRFGYGDEKAQHVIQTQNMRGAFELLGVCRFSLVNMGLEREWFPEYLSLATGHKFNWDILASRAESAFSLIRAFWIRENGGVWSSGLEIPPPRWFKEPLTEGPLKGSKLDLEKFNILLQSYYRMRGWDPNGVPTKPTLAKLGLTEVLTKN